MKEYSVLAHFDVDNKKTYDILVEMLEIMVDYGLCLCYETYNTNNGEQTPDIMKGE